VERIGWRRLLIVTAIGALAVITADRLGLVHWLDRALPRAA
jgi:hypothetical protein